MRVLREAVHYQFKTFSVGVVVPEGVREREDQVRSDLRIRGLETIKSQISKEVAGFIQMKMHRRVDRRHPELTILADFEEDTVSATSKSLFVHARYTKPKGVHQKKEFCTKCSGRGCAECDGGYARVPSMEGILSKRFRGIFGSQRSKFTWIGSEDADSIVYPPGRPFIAEVKNPKRRQIPPRFTVKTGRGNAQVTDAKILRWRPVTTPPFVFMTRALIESPSNLNEANLSKVKRTGHIIVRYENNKNRVVEKSVYSISAKRKGHHLVAEIKMDGGLPVKRYIAGESVSPSLSETLGIPLVCRSFDILRVWESRSGKSRAQRASLPAVRR